VRRAALLAALLVAFGAAVVVLDIRQDPLAVPEPRLFFLFDKMYLSPVRVVSLLAVVITFFPVFSLIGAPLGPVTTYLCGLGRNSLAVFSVASLLALSGQVVRFISEGGFLVDAAIVVSGLSIMGCTAWLADRYQSASLSSQPPRS
jgi:hypothetical protein